MTRIKSLDRSKCLLNTEFGSKLIYRGIPILLDLLALTEGEGSGWYWRGRIVGYCRVNVDYIGLSGRLQVHVHVQSVMQVSNKSQDNQLPIVNHGMSLKAIGLHFGKTALVPSGIS